MPACCRGEPLIVSQKRRIERFSQRQIDGIISAEIVPKFPYAGQKNIVWMSPQRKDRQIDKHGPTAIRVHLSRHRIPANDLGDFDIDQVRRMKSMTATEQLPPDGLCRRRTQQHLDQRRGVDDDHRLSRSARTARTGSTEGVTTVRLSNRARISSIVGRSATSRICCNR